MNEQGEIIRRRRERLRMTHARLAQAAGVGREALIRVEKGEGNHSHRTLQKIQGALQAEEFKRGSRVPVAQTRDGVQDGAGGAASQEEDASALPELDGELIEIQLRSGSLAKRSKSHYGPQLVGNLQFVVTEVGTLLLVLASPHDSELTASGLSGRAVEAFAPGSWTHATRFSI